MSNFPWSEEVDTEKIPDVDLTMSELQTVVAGWDAERAAEEEQFSELMSPVQQPTYPGEGSGGSPLIPGPAQKIQVALRRKKNKHPSTINNLGEALPTQEVMNVIAAEDNGGDNDFEVEPWITAIKDVRHEARLQQIPKDFLIWTPIKEIFDGTKNWGKIHKVVVMIKSLEPNGLGDLMTTLKDPTGTIGASIHHKVFSTYGNDIKVGAVFVLQKVSVCRFSRKECFLNITVANVDKVYTKENYIQPEYDSDENQSPSVSEENCSDPDAEENWIVPDSEDEMDN